jgi:hypothetical protein
MWVTPIPLPTVRIADQFGDTTSCGGTLASLTLNITGIPAAGSSATSLQYSWVSPNNFIGNLVTPSHLITVDTTTIFRIEGYDADTRCRNHGSYYYVFMIPNDRNLEEINFKDTICERMSYRFVAEFIPDMIYYWQTVYGMTTRTDILTINNVTSQDTGTYRLIRNWYGCLDTSFLALSIKPTPVSNVFSSNLALCERTILQLSAEPAGTLYSWRTPENNVISGHLIDKEIQKADSGIWYFVVSEDGCSDSTGISVRVDSRISPIIEICRTTHYCSGDEIQFTYIPNAPDNRALEYALHLRTQRIDGADPLLHHIYHQDSGIAMLLVDHLACQDTAFVDIEVRIRPNPQPNVQPNYCIGEDVLISIEQENGVVYEWHDWEGKLIGTSDYFRFPNIDETHIGDYSLTATINECSSFDAFKIMVYAMPIVDFSPYEYLCIGDTLLIDMMRPNATYLWSTGDTEPRIRVTEGNQIYEVTVTQNNCSTTAYQFIEGRPKPIFKLPNDTIICIGSYLRIDSEISDAGVHFYWTMDDEFIPGDSYILANAPGMYKLVAELNTCIWSDSLSITNKFCDAFELPTAFRPESSNELNREFKPAKLVPEGLVVYEMFIYDKWGKLLFRSKDPNVGWDGRDLNGRKVQPGVYVYVIKAHETLGGTDLSTSGTVTLVQ